MERSQIEHTKKGSARKRKPTAKEIADVYSKKAANKSATAMALGVSRNTLDHWREKDPKLNELMTDVEEALLDFSESKLLEQIKDGNMTAVIFHLKTKGKKRGYTEGEEVEVRSTSDLDLSGLTNEEMVLFGKLLKKTKRNSQ